jgi:hypothetical protein
MIGETLANHDAYHRISAYSDASALWPGGDGREGLDLKTSPLRSAISKAAAIGFPGYPADGLRSQMISSELSGGDL